MRPRISLFGILYLISSQAFAETLKLLDLLMMFDDISKGLDVVANERNRNC